uniref:Uncharacterized protein n=1 Tax=Panagrolaimus sp. ES5 TaxID=591445 RepID=A0AC34FW70_9BILA
MKDEKTICPDKYCPIWRDDDDRKCCVKIDITKTSSKLWITDELNIHGDGGSSNFIPLLRQKLFRYEIRYLRICKKIVTFDDFKFLASSPESIRLWWTEIIDTAGNIVMLETFIEYMLNAHPTLEIHLDFDLSISEDYANELDGLIDAILESERKNLVISYPEQDQNKLKLMESRYYKRDLDA